METEFGIVQKPTAPAARGDWRKNAARVVRGYTRIVHTGERRVG